MIIKNLRQHFFLFMRNRFAKQHSSIDSGSPELLLNPFIPLLSILLFHIGEVPVVFPLVVEEVHEVVVYVPLQLHFKSFHGILFQC